ncbi:MAG: hypothetical protein ACE5HL_09780 [Terriglobia bacterium]
MNLPIFPVRLVRENIALTEALAEVGVRVREGYVLFGIEVHLKEGKEPTVRLELEPGSTLGDALRQIFRQLPNYRFEIAGERLINIYPVGAKEDPDDILNVHVARFDVVDEQPSSLLSRPKDFIPELKDRLTPERTGPPRPSGYFGVVPTGTGPTVTVHLRNVTVRQILNAVTEAMEEFPPDYMPVGWVYSFEGDPASPIGGEHSWMFHWSVPSSWKEEAAKSRNNPIP